MYFIFLFCRMKGKKARERKEAATELEQNIHLVKAPVALQLDSSLTLPKAPEKLKVRVQTGGQVEAMQE